MRLNRVIWLTLLCLSFVLLAEQYTGLDVSLQNHFFDSQTSLWIITLPMHRELDFIFYDGLKHFVAFWGTISVLIMLASLRIKKLRPKITAAMTVLLCTIIIPSSINRLKKNTDIYCPNQLEIYNGTYPYVKILEPYPEGTTRKHPGHCFPAGHVSGLFSLMALGYYFCNRRRRYAVITATFGMAWIGGLYQMLRGEHFLSHTLITMILVPILIMIIHRLVCLGVSRILQFSRQR